MKRIGDIEVDDRDFEAGGAERFSWYDAHLVVAILNRLNYRGYSDWRLPTKDELNDIYRRKDEIGGFSLDYYWSSTETISNYALNQNFYNGYQYDVYKGNGYRVRCVRSFKN